MVAAGAAITEIQKILLVKRWLIASWDAPAQAGGITTQGKDLAETVREQMKA